MRNPIDSQEFMDRQRDWLAGHGDEPRRMRMLISTNQPAERCYRLG
jgi:hypothetical protein